MVIFLGDITTHSEQSRGHHKTSNYNTHEKVAQIKQGQSPARSGCHMYSLKLVNNPGNNIIWEECQSNCPLFLSLVINVPP